MKKILTIVLVIALSLVLVLAAGCPQPAPAPAPVTPVPTPTEEITVATPAPTAMPTTLASTTPGPVQTLPAAWGIEMQVASNSETIDPQIIATFRGGKGLNLIPEIDIRVTRSDGVVEDAKMTQPFYVGKAISLPGTRENKDRAEVWAITPQGDKIKIYDAYVPFRQY